MNRGFRKDGEAKRQTMVQTEAWTCGALDVTQTFIRGFWAGRTCKDLKGRIVLMRIWKAWSWNH